MLRVFKYNKLKLQDEYFSDTDKLLIKCGIKLDNTFVIVNNMINKNSCVICYDDENLIMLKKIDYKICSNCIYNYVKININENIISSPLLKYPMDFCNLYLESSTIKSLLNKDKALLNK